MRCCAFATRGNYIAYKRAQTVRILRSIDPERLDHKRQLGRVSTRTTSSSSSTATMSSSDATAKAVTTGDRHAVSDATKTRAEELKTEGNAALAAFRFPAAVELYSAAIALYPTAIYYANRAAAHMKTESYGLAIDDASAAIELEPSYIKGTSFVLW